MWTLVSCLSKVHDYYSFYLCPWFTARSTFYKGDNFCEFLFSHQASSEKGSTLKGKNLLLFFLSVPFPEGGKINFDRVASPRNELVHLKVYIKDNTWINTGKSVMLQYTLSQRNTLIRNNYRIIYIDLFFITARQKANK